MLKKILKQNFAVPGDSFALLGDNFVLPEDSFSLPLSFLDTVFAWRVETKLYSMSLVSNKLAT